MATRKITGILIKLGLDTKDVEGGLQAIDKSFAKSASELKQINKALKLDPTNTELLSQKYDVLNQMLEKSRQKLKALEDAQEAMSKKVSNNAEFQKAYEPLQQSLAKTTAELEKLKNKKEAMDDKLINKEITNDQYKKYRRELKDTEKAQEDLQNQIKELEKEFESQGGHISEEQYRLYRRELEQVRTETARLERQTNELEGVTDQSSRAFRRAVENTDEYKRAVDKLNASAGELKSKVGGALNDIWNIATKVGTALFSAAAASSAAAVKVGSDFDASMSSVQALSGAVGIEFDVLREKAKEMGATTSKTAKESADALGYMALAGWDTQQMLEGLEPILRASEAGNMDLATTSDLVTDSMSAMGVSVNDLTHYLDVATKAQSSSNTSLEQLLNAYVVAGNTFKNFNVSLEESSTLLGVLANRGIKGSEAGKAINSVLINLIGANKNAASAMDALGVSAYDANGKFIGITETLRLVAKSLEDVSDQDRAIFTAKIGGKTQYDILQALLSGVNEEYDDLLGKIQDSNGALEATAKIMRDNLKGDITMLKSALQDLGIEVNDQFTEAFREAVQVVTKEVSKLNNAVSDKELGESLKKIAEAFAKVIEQIAKFATNTGIPAAIEFFEFIVDNGPLVKSLIVTIASSFAAFKIISTITGIWKSFIKTVDDYKKAAETAKSTTKALTAAIGVNPWVLLGAAVAVVATGLITFSLNADTASNRIRNYKKEIEKLDKEVQDFSETTQKSISRSEAEIAVIEKNAREYEELREVKDRNVKQEERLKDLANDLQQYMPDSIKLIDEQTGAYNSLAGSIDGVIASMKKNAYVQAYNNQITEIATAQIEAKKTLEDLQKEFDAIDTRLKSKGAYESDGTIGFDNFLDAAVNTPDLLKWENAKKAVDEAKRTIEDYDKQIEELGKDVENVYSDFSKNQIVEASADGARIAAEGMAKKYQEEGKKAAETAAQEAEGILLAFQQEMDDLDYKKNIHGFADDTEYWSERRRVLNEYLLKESEEWWKYYDETEEYFDKLTEEQKKAYEKQISDQAEALKERKELDDDFTDEMYYNELEKLISVLSAESDTYKKYNSEILKGRKALGDNLAKEAAESAKAQAQTQLESVKNSISEIKAEYSKMLSDVVSEREAYKNKLSGMAELFTSEKDSKGNKTAILNNIDDIGKAIDDYDKKITNLEARGAGKNLIGYMEGLSEEDAKDFEHFLNTMTDEQLKAYSDKYDKVIETINKRAEARYAPQIEAINKGFTEKVTEQMAKLEGDMAEQGKNAIDGFIKGFTEDPEKLVEAVAEQCTAVLDGFKKGLDIHSPSKKTEEMGEYAGAGFEKGLESVSGADAAETFADDFIKKMAEKDSQLHDVLYNAFAGNTMEAINAMNAEAKKAFASIPKLSLPNVPTVKIPAGASIQTKQQTDGRVLDALSDILSTLAMIMSAIQQLANRPIVVNTTLNNEERLFLDGMQIAKSVTQKQYQESKRQST